MCVNWATLFITYQHITLEILRHEYGDQEKYTESDEFFTFFTMALQLHFLLHKGVYLQ